LAKKPKGCEYDTKLHVGVLVEVTLKAPHRIVIGLRALVLSHSTLCAFLVCYSDKAVILTGWLVGWS
jgi:hypothetical protein